MFDLHIRSHSRLLMLLALVAFAAATASTVPALAAAPDQMDGQEIFGGDTFVLDGGVLRPATDTTAPDEQLYNVVGTSLDLTWVGGSRPPRCRHRPGTSGAAPTCGSS